MKATLLSLALCLVGCASSPPEVTRYLIRADRTGPSGQLDAPVRIGLGRVAVAPYLDSEAGIVIETASGEVRTAERHRWAEPLAAGLHSLLRAEISDALGYQISADRAGPPRPDFTVDVYFDRLHATMQGNAVLEASYRITPRTADSEAREFRFSSSAPLPAEGYDAVVATEAGLVRELARAIADALRDAKAG